MTGSNRSLARKMLDHASDGDRAHHVVRRFCERYGVGAKGRWPTMRAWLVREIAEELRLVRSDATNVERMASQAYGDEQEAAAP